MSRYGSFPVLAAEEIAEIVPHGALVAFSGFTPAGAAKSVPRALARRAREMHRAGLPYQLRVLTGASTGTSIDDALAEAEAISWRAPFQSSNLLRRQSRGISEMADILVPKPPPYRPGLDLDHPLQRIGKTYARVDPEKVIGVVETDEADECGHLSASDSVSQAIAGHVVEFLANELISGRLPHQFLPIQSGVGNVANAVLEGIGASPDIPNFVMYTEVLQSAAFELMARGRILGASTCGLVITSDQARQLNDEFRDFAPRMVLRPQEISNIRLWSGNWALSR